MPKKTKTSNTSTTKPPLPKGPSMGPSNLDKSVKPRQPMPEGPPMGPSNLDKSVEPRQPMSGEPSADLSENITETDESEEPEP